MKRIRMHNDISLSWTITNESGIDLSDAEVTLLSERNVAQVIDYSIDNDVVTLEFLGMNQTVRGVYRLLLQKNRGAADMVTLDCLDAFELTGPCSFGIVEGEDDGGVTTAVVELSSRLVRIGGSSEGGVTDVRVGGASVVNNSIAYIPAIPTATSELYNDSGFVTSDDIPSISLERETRVGGLNMTIDGTSTPILATTRPDSEEERTYTAASWEGLLSLIADSTQGESTWERAGDSAVPTIGMIREHSGYASISDIPTKTSELDNDSDYITSTALADYVTSTMLATELADYITTATLNSLLAVKSDKVSKETTEDTIIMLTPDTLYVCSTPIVSGVTLSVGLQEADDDGRYAHEYRLRFSTGTTVGTVDITEDVTFPSDDDLSIEANKTYEINVCDGLGVWQSWDNA